jgi:DMSO/TMAO reductase YedYZ heme-binding membrane subunit
LNRESCPWTRTQGGKRHGHQAKQEPEPVPHDAVNDPDRKPAEHPAALRPHEERGTRCRRERRPGNERSKCCGRGQPDANYEQSERGDNFTVHEHAGCGDAGDQHGIHIVDHQHIVGDDLHKDEGVLSTTAEDLLEVSPPSPLQILAPLAALAFVIAVVWSGADSKTVWYVIRATGIIAYVLLAISVVLGLLITGRVVPSGRPRVDVYEIHLFTSLLALAFALAHALSLLLDNFVTFSPVQILVPFTSNYRPFSVALGIVGIYLTAAVYGSFWIRRRIGYRRWRVFHYMTFAAFVLLTIHGILSGADAHTAWMIVIVIAACLTVTALTIYHAAPARPASRRPA